MPTTNTRATAVWIILLQMSGLLSAGFAQNAGPTGLSKDDALRLVRNINTAEASLFLAENGDHRYAPLAKALQYAGLQLPEAVTLTDETSGSVKDYTLSLVSSADGRHFTLGLMPTTPKDCGPSFFSNESGVIYPAKALGCP